MSYWSETGKYQKEYNALFEELVPSSGPSDFVEGESLRAITKITYDYNNNGFGNNWSGAYNWLINHNMIDSSEAITLAYYSTGRCASRTANQFEDSDPIIIVLNSIMDRVIENILSMKESLTPHADDMYNYSEKDDYGWDDEYDDEYGAWSDEDEDD